MSTVGIDLGSLSSVIGVVRGGRIEIVQNEVSSRQTSAIVGFTNKQRAIGEEGKTQALRNVRHTIYSPKRLLGRPYGSSDLVPELNRLGGVQWVAMEDGTIGAKVSLRGEQLTLTAEQLVSMLITDLKKTCEKATESHLVTAVLSVPSYFTSKQRQAVIDAASIAGVNVTALINDLSAAAVNWGFYRFDIKDPQRVMFVSMGGSSFQASLVEFTENQARVLAHGFDPFFGGDTIDEEFATLVSNRFQEKYKVDLREDKRAWYRVVRGIDRVKKNLNENEQSSFGVECLYQDRDLNDLIKREDYINLLKGKGYLDRVEKVLATVLEDAKLTKADLNDVEWLGSGLRVVPVREKVREFLGRERLSNTMNAEEGVAQGCALYCAMLSPLVKVRDYKLVEYNSFEIDLVWRDLDSDTTQFTPLYKKGAPYGKSHRVTLKRPAGAPFEVDLRYNPAALPMAVEKDGIITRAKITNIPHPHGDAEVRVQCKLDINGIATIVNAEVVEKKEVTEEVPIEEKPGEGAKDEKKEVKPEEKKEDKMETDSKKDPSSESTTEKKEEKPKTRTETRIKTIYTPVQTEFVITQGLGAVKVNAMAKLELEMREKDRLAIEAANAKNELESFVYLVRDKLAGDWTEFATEQESSSLLSLCEATEQWLYEDGEDEATPAYRAKLAPLKAIADPIALRLVEWASGAVALADLRQAVVHYKSEATSGKEEYAHIKPEELQSIVSECDHVLELLQEGGKLKMFDERKKTDNPVFMTKDLSMRKNNLSAKAERILNTPKPPPPKVEEPPKAAEKPADGMDVDGNASASAQESPADPTPKAEADTMDTSS